MEWYNVGKLVNTHGIRGEVRVISQTDFPEERFAVGTELAIFEKDAKRPMKLVKVASSRPHKNFILLTFEGHPFFHDVEPLKGTELKIHEKYLEELGDDDFYFHEIVGCKVFDTEDNEIGDITEIFQTGANDVWAIKGVNGKMHYIPVIADVVKEVDVDEKRIVIELMEGLLS